MSSLLIVLRSPIEICSFIKNLSETSQQNLILPMIRSRFSESITNKLQDKPLQNNFIELITMENFQVRKIKIR